MSLKKYQQKRNFKVTPEPKGRVSKSKKQLLYLVQKHAASHLHYDFRLELNGVLKSWAVPKGPSLDPAQKRLAVEVEDHPIEYGSFEGVIPKGHYGAGTVLLWDTGTWECEGDPQKSYRAGNMTFTLYGKKLKGKWKLIRISFNKEEGKKNNWLLMKLADDQAQKNVDILQEEPLSVKSNRTMQEIASGDPSNETKSKKINPTSKSANQALIKKISELTHVKKKSQPNFIRPQLSTPVEKPPASNDWLHEIKYDGYRMLGILKNKKIKLVTRNEQDWTQKFPSIVTDLKTLPIDTVMLDGEIVALNTEGSMDFQTLQNVLKDETKATLKYFVFDIPYSLGYDLTQTPLIERKEFLRFLFKQWIASHPNIEYSDYIQGHGDVTFKRACASALEGIMAKAISSPYESRRTRTWLKIKCTHRQEFVIGGFTQPRASRQYFGALLVGYYNEKNQFIYCGRVGTGFNEKSLSEIYQALIKLKQKENPFNQFPKTIKTSTVTWVKPKLVCEVEFMDWTQDGILRVPAFQGLREDKSASQVHKENTTALPKIKKGSSAAKVANVNLTHSDKDLFPPDGITKEILADYYDQISHWMLPYVTHRPLVLLRCPSGYQHKCFFQKHFDKALKYIHLVKITEKDEQVNYSLINDKNGLIALAQLNVLEIHLWGSNADNVEKPNQIVFDLDPDPNVEWKEVLQSALLVKEYLDELKLKSFIKTTGGKGLHIVIPITRRYEWPEINAFTRAIAQNIVQKHPRQFIATMTKSKRHGKIFVDYLRNARGATAVAPYSTRAHAGAPISTPVTWKELPAIKSADQYTISNIMERINKLKKDPWEGFFETRQNITPQMKLLKI